MIIGTCQQSFVLFCVRIVLNELFYFLSVDYIQVGRWINRSFFLRQIDLQDIIIGVISAWDDRLFRHTAQDDRQWERKDYREEVLQAVRGTAGFTLMFTNFSDQPQVSSVIDREGKEVMIFSIGNSGGYAGSAEINLASARGTSRYTVRNITPKIVDLGEFEPDQGAAALIEPYLTRTEEFLSRPVGQLEETLLSRESFFSDAPMTSLIHTLQLSLTNAHVSFASVPAYNDQLPSGTVLARDIFQLFPNESFLFSIRMTGREIREYLEYSYSRWFNTMRGPYDSLIKFTEEGIPEVPYYQYDSAGGIRYTVDVTKQPGERIEIIEFSDGRPFRLQDTYIAAVNSFRIIGGGGHLQEGAGISAEDAAGRIVSASTRSIRHNLIRWFEANRTFTPSLEPQWYVVPESWGAAGRLNDYPRLFEQSPFE